MLLVEDGNLYKITNANEEEKNIIKDDLTLDNPKYLQALRYSKYKNTKIPKYLYYYEEDKEGNLYVPNGYNIPLKYKITKDLREEVTVNYPPINIHLRGTQLEAYNSFLDNPSGIIQLPTGKGKSILAIYIAYALRQKTLVIVHKDDLVVGWNKDIDTCFNGAMLTGLIKAKKRLIGNQITIATVQTLNRMSEEELNLYTKDFGLIVVDEVHHAGADSYHVLNKFFAPYKLGLTATMERSDKLEKVINFRLGDIVYKAKYKKDDEDILPVLVNTIDTEVYYRPKVSKNTNGEFILDKLGKIYIDEIEDFRKRPNIPYHYLDDLVIRSDSYTKLYIDDILEQHNLGRSIIVFLRQKGHCRFIKKQLISKGVKEENIMLYYGDSTESKAEMMKRAEDNRNLITIATLSVATEGTNVKQWEVAFLISSLAEPKSVEQAVGRIRRSTDKPKLKVPIVFDYRHPNVYIIKNHGYARDKRYRKLKLKVNKDFGRLL